MRIPHKRFPWLLTLCIVFILPPVQAEQSSFTEIPALSDSSLLKATINAAGNVIVGTQNASAFKWTKADGIQKLGTINNQKVDTYATAVNAAGDMIVGYGSDIITHQYQALIWTQSGSIQSLGTLNGGYTSRATGINADGNVIVGYANDGSISGTAAIRAFRWTATEGMNSLGTLNGGYNSQATGIDADGNVIIGSADDGSIGGSAVRAFRWTAAEGMKSLGTLNGGSSSEANAISADGHVIVGFANDGSIGSNAMRAFRWTAAEGMKSLGTLNGSDNSSATAVNANGDVVVGNTYHNNTVNDYYRAFRWSQTDGMQSIEDWLTAHGVNISPNIHTLSANGINSEGNVIVGTLSNNNIFLARVLTDNSGSGNNSGLIDVTSFNQGLARVANASSLATSNAALVMNGMHSNPMRMLLNNGESSFSTGGDIGRQDHLDQDTSLGLGDMTYAHRFNHLLQINTSIGHTYSHTDTGLGGATTAQSTYIMPQFIFTLPANTYLSADLFYGLGDINIHRAYLNAGNQELATAAPNTNSMGARLRLDWLNALSFGHLNITPYSSLTYVQTKMDGYTEQGAAFPVHWNSRTDRATTARLGIDAIHHISDTWTLTGKLEAAHRFENREADTSGQIEGLYDFAFAGDHVKQNWLRIGAGSEINIGKSVVSVMLNATTKGDAPSYWLSANYRWHF